MSEEEIVVKILIEKFNPEAIILVGSRADGTATESSDWDTFLFCGERRAGIEILQDTLKIDVNFSSWPNKEQYFDAGFGPVHPIKVLYDRSNGQLNNLLGVTQIAYDKGPLKIQPEICTLHMRVIERTLEKLEKYQNNKELAFYYKGMFLRSFLTVWFEQQNMWERSPVLALAFIKENSEHVYLELKQLIDSSGEKSVQVAKKLIGLIASLKE
jgi:hypothetical protein